MKKIILLIAFLSAGFLYLKAQQGKRGDKIEALKIAFITQKLALSSEEARQFWPVYGQYESEIRSAIANRDNNDVIDNDEKILNIRKKYRPEFTKTVGQGRANKLFSIEKEFRTVLLQHLKERNNR